MYCNIMVTGKKDVLMSNLEQTRQVYEQIAVDNDLIPVKFEPDRRNYDPPNMSVIFSYKKVGLSREQAQSFINVWDSFCDSKGLTQVNFRVYYRYDDE